MWQVWQNGVYDYAHAAVGFAPAFHAGDFVGIEREGDGITYHCYYSPNGTSWSRLAEDGGSSTFVRAGMPNPGATRSTMPA